MTAKLALADYIHICHLNTRMKELENERRQLTLELKNTLERLGVKPGQGLNIARDLTYTIEDIGPKEE